MALQHHFQTTNSEGIPLAATATAVGNKWAQDVNIVGPDGGSLGTTENPLRAIIDAVIEIARVTVTNFPEVQRVVVDNFPGQQEHPTTTEISNWPANQTVTVSNWPTQANNEVLNGQVVDATLTIPSGGVIRAQAGTTALANRKRLILSGGSDGLTYGYTQNAQGFSLYRDETIELPIGPNITVWVRSGSGAGQITVAEFN